MRWRIVVPMAAGAVLGMASQALAALDRLCPLDGTVVAAPVVAATEPLAAFALGLGLVGARYFRRRK